MGAPLVPLNDLTQIDRYIAAGAEELYMGFYDPSWNAAFGPYADLNRMSGFGTEANAYTLENVMWAAGAVAARGRRLYVTFNTAAYGADKSGCVVRYFSLLASTGAAGVILSGPEFMDAAKECGLQVVASTMCAVYNHQIAAFYRDCGADRIILPRDLSLADIRAIVDGLAQTAPEGAAPMEYEVFCMRNGCVFSDSHCLGMHGMGRGALCGEIRVGARKLRSSQDVGALRENSDVWCRSFHTHACGLCALWDFEQMGISAYKVVGRGDMSDAIAEDTQLITDELAIARNCSTREEYLRRMRPHPYAEQVCVRGLNCYYPESRRVVGDGAEDAPSEGG